MNKTCWISLCLGITLALATVTVHAQEMVAPETPQSITITQLDPSRFPEMVVYIDAEASGLPAGLTKEDFTVTEDDVPAEIISFAGEGEPRPVDIVFVFDTTGSMGDEILGVIDTSLAFADQLHANNRDFRLGLVTFADEIGSVRNADGTLTAQAEEFKGWVGELFAAGGDDDPEIALDGLEAATHMQFRPDAQKVLILITDAPPHERGDGTPFSQVTAAELTPTLRDSGFTVYAAAYDHPYYRDIVTETSGEFYELTPAADFMGIIDKIGGDIAKQYRLTYRSPRASYDGTRRNIAISVGGKTGAEAYLEEHLLNIQSDPIIGIILLLPLVLALVIPATIGRQSRPRSLPAAGVQAAAATVFDMPPAETVEWRNPSQQPASASAQPQTTAVAPPNATQVDNRCTNCGHELRPGAKFCGRCGQTVNVVAAAPQTSFCPQCGQAVRPGAKFCGVCGQKL